MRSFFSIIMKFIFLCVLALLCVSSSVAIDLIAGTSYQARLTWQEKCEYMAFPFAKREKNVFYSDPGQQIIKGIIVRENTQTNAVVLITAGGVGFSYANIRLESERSHGLYYTVEVYV